MASSTGVLVGNGEKSASQPYQISWDGGRNERGTSRAAVQRGLAGIQIEGQRILFTVAMKLPLPEGQGGASRSPRVMLKGLSVSAIIAGPKSLDPFGEDGHVYKEHLQILVLPYADFSF